MPIAVIITRYLGRSALPALISGLRGASPPPDSLGRVITSTSGEQKWLRLLSFIEQGIFSAANFITTLVIARTYSADQFAGFGAALSVAWTLQSLHRATFVAPFSIWSESKFDRLAAGLAGQHLIVLSAVQLLFFCFFLVSSEVSIGAMGEAGILSTISTVFVFFSVDFERAFLIRCRHRLISLGISSLYIVVTLGLALGARFYGLPFETYVIVLGGFGAIRTGLAILFSAKPNFRHGIMLLRECLRTNFGWGTVGILASVGYGQAPLFVLGHVASPAQVAAYSGMRSPLGPLQILIRSLDVVDKLLYSRIPMADIEGRRRRFWLTYMVYLGCSLACAIVVALFAKSIALLMLGSSYVEYWPTLVAWSCVLVCLCSTPPLETIIYRAGRLRDYALIQLAGAVVAIASAFPLSHWLLAPGAVLACLAGWLVTYSGVWLFIVWPLVRRG